MAFLNQERALELLASRELWRTVAGLLGLGLVVAGVWGLGGWQWAAIVAGFPIAAFYLWAELVALRPLPEPEE